MHSEVPPIKLPKIIPSNTLMRFRKLRIAWSVGCGIACVLLIVLWVRSYKTLYWCYGLPHNGQVLHLHVAEGLFILFTEKGCPPGKSEVFRRKPR